jgi:hypothetical protein
MFHQKFLRLLVLTAPLAACSTSSPQVLTGRIAPGFPAAITTVRAVQSGRVVASSTVAADGSFRIEVGGSNLALQLVGAGKTQLVFPRQTGGIATSFGVRAGGSDFDLGAVRFIGAAGSTPFSFHDGTSETECHDGLDATGATCVDDEDNTAHDTCEGGDDTTVAGSDDVDDGLTDDGDAVADHNFPADGCADDGAAHDGSDGSDDGSGHGSDG